MKNNWTTTGNLLSNSTTYLADCAIVYHESLNKSVLAPLPMATAKAMLLQTFTRLHTRKQTALDRGQTDRITLTHDLDLWPWPLVPYSHAKDQVRRSVGSKERVEKNGWTDERTEAVALPDSQMRSVTKPQTLIISDICTYLYIASQAAHNSRQTSQICSWNTQIKHTQARIIRMMFYY